MLKVAIIVQARMGATRLPGKPLKTVLNRPLLSYLFERLARVKNAQVLAIATTLSEKDEPIVEWAKKEGILCIRGSEEDVLGRYVVAADQLKADVIVRITADCPLIDPKIISGGIQEFLSADPPLDYLSNTKTRTYPRGMDVEILSYPTLIKASQHAQSIQEREHVTLYVYEHPELFQIDNFCYKEDDSAYRLTVDTIEDFELIQKIIEILYPQNPKFSLEDILTLLKSRPDLVAINRNVKQKPI